MPRQAAEPYRLFGMAQSYFTRKIQSYFEYKQIPYRFRRFAAAHPEARAAGWPGGVPVVRTPAGEYTWDTTSIILHLETQRPEPTVLPTDPLQRFLCFVIEDVVDEWFYRPAVGSRWFFDENRDHGSWELTKDMTVETPLPAKNVQALLTAYMTQSCGPFGATRENIDSWIDEVVKPWFRVLNAHFSTSEFLFGARPSLADFAIFGSNAAHFVNDPVCRGWADELGPEVVKHTHRLLEPEEIEHGEWSRAHSTPESLIAILADIGRIYLPWVTEATRDGRAQIEFASGKGITVEASPFLKESRGVLLARYIALRSDALDQVLERADILKYFEPYLDQALSIPDTMNLPQPKLNRPFAPPESAEDNLRDQVPGVT